MARSRARSRSPTPTHFNLAGDSSTSGSRLDNQINVRPSSTYMLDLEGSTSTRSPFLPPTTPQASSSCAWSASTSSDITSTTAFPSDDLPNRWMTNSPRRRSSEDRVPASPSSSSQGGMADFGLEGERGGQQSEAPSPTSSTTKKKRTRTLTTPHQAAVLHALLAQSRFPTTQMREEVGLTIGLSARKVQIWFQNQRQKAKNPRSGTASSTARPPQYAAFPDHPGSSRSRDHSPSHPPFDALMDFENRPFHGSEDQMERPTSSSFDSNSQLLGPGMPGMDPRLTHPLISREIETHSPLLENRGHMFRTFRAHPYSGAGVRHSESPPGLHLATSRPTTAHGHPRVPDLSRPLPLLSTNRPHRRESFSSSDTGIRPSPVFSATPSAMGIESRYQSPEVRFAHRVPEQSENSMVIVSPSYGNYPRTHWDSSFPSTSRSGTSSWSGHSIGGESSTSLHERPTTSWTETRQVEEHLSHEDADPHESPPTSRSGRYDPVRGVFVPYTIDSSPSTRQSDDQ